MDTQGFLADNREAILRRWFDIVVESYPAHSSAFLKGQRDRFRNPVGHAISEAVAIVYDQMLAEMDTTVVGEALDSIIRIRSVQDFTPADAVGWVFGLKSLIREALDERGFDGTDISGLSEIEARIDRVALVAFEKYTECRERLFEVKMNDLKRRSRWLPGRSKAAGYEEMGQ
jgi:hypothetical protein